MNAITPTALEAVGIIDATNRSSRFPATEKRPPLIPHDAKDDKPMTKLRIFRPGVDEPEIREIELDAEPGFHELVDIIMPFLGKGHLEHVAVLDDGERNDMFVDDMGQLKRLPRNEAATAIYRASHLSRHPETDPETMSYIYGVAVMFDRRVWF